MTPSAYVMCGLSFSGKSTAARRIARELGVDLINLDAINHERGLRGGEGMSVEQWEETSFLAMDRLRGCLRAGRSVVVDDTFSHRFLRDRCRAVVAECGADFVILYLDTRLETIAARRQENYRQPGRHHVREEVFAAHAAGFQCPTPDEEPLVRLRNEEDLTRWIEARKDHTGRAGVNRAV